MEEDPLAILEEAIRGSDGFVELRYHAKATRLVSVEKGKIERTQSRRRSGVGVRVLDKGTRFATENTVAWAT